MSYLLFAFGLVSECLAAPVASDMSPPTTGDIISYLHSRNPMAWKDIPFLNGTQGKFVSIPTAELNAAEEALRGGSTQKRAVDAAINSGALAGAKRYLQPSINCFGSGSWALQSTLNGYIPNACDVFISNAGTGSSLLASFRDTNEAGDAMSILYRHDILVTNPAANDDCIDALSSIIYNSGCEGKSSDTRGGTVTLYDTDYKVNVAVYSVDPQTDNCNC